MRCFVYSDALVVDDRNSVGHACLRWDEAGRDDRRTGRSPCLADCCEPNRDAKPAGHLATATDEPNSASPPISPASSLSCLSVFTPSTLSQTHVPCYILFCPRRKAHVVHTG